MKSERILETEFNNFLMMTHPRSHSGLINFSAVGITTDYGLGGCGSIPDKDKRFFFTPQRPDRLWGPPSLLSNGYCGLFHWGQSGRGVKLTTNSHLVQRSRMVELYLHFPTRLHGVVIN
jgi:hypothetical protein